MENSSENLLIFESKVDFGMSSISNFGFICGLISTAAVTIAILTGTLYATIIFVVLLVIAFKIITKPKTNQPPTSEGRQT